MFLPFHHPERGPVGPRLHRLPNRTAVNAIGLDLTTLAIVWLASSIVLIPLLVVAVRFAVLPLLETVARVRNGTGAGDAAVEQRLARAEASLARMAREIERLAEASAARAS
jgi:hypothetical protein